MNYLRAFLFTLFSVTAFQAFATTAAPALVGDAAHGQVLSQTCVACHGADGKAILPAYPNLGGQHASYIVHSLVEFKKGPAGMRNNPIMLGMATPLSDQDMADLAAYYESQVAITGAADASLVKLGEKIYHGGVMDDRVPACSGCHGPKGAGVASAKYPRIAGQNSDYTVAQLMAFQKDERKSPNDMMSGVTAHMTPAEMAAVASYIQGLH